MTEFNDHDLLIRVSTILESLNGDVGEMKKSMKELFGLPSRVETLEGKLRTQAARNNALIIGVATIVSTVVAVIARFVMR